MMVVDDKDAQSVINLINEKAKTGFIGDGKIFMSPVEASYTIRTGEAVL
jgi:nitrogen regulatory protein PII